jgi:RIO kinase 1
MMNRGFFIRFAKIGFLTMAKRDDYTELELPEDFDELPAIRNLPRKKQRLKERWNPHHKPKGVPPEIRQQLAEQVDGKEHFDFSYNASLHEREWIVNSLGGFYEGHWLDDVLHLIKGGKEAHVYQCLANESVPGLGQPYLAAKVYRPRLFRSLKNDHIYRENRQNLDSDGRLIKNEGMLNAIRHRSAYGLDLLHTSWIEHEFQALQLLHSAGCDVPMPYERGDNAILMGYIGNEELPAPTLNEVELDPDEARPLFKRLLRNIERMLASDRVHADLSAYNVLYWKGKITLIDFPQVIDPHTNSNAWRIFERDVRRVCEYFARQGVRSSPRKIAAELWTSHGHRLQPDVHPSLLDDQDEGDRAYWERMKRAA